jgi:hypothetical protein
MLLASKGSGVGGVGRAEGVAVAAAVEDVEGVMEGYGDAPGDSVGDEVAAAEGVGVTTGLRVGACVGTPAASTGANDSPFHTRPVADEAIRVQGAEAALGASVSNRYTNTGPAQVLGMISPVKAVIYLFNPVLLAAVNTRILTDDIQHEVGCRNQRAGNRTSHLQAMSLIVDLKW